MITTTTINSPFDTLHYSESCYTFFVSALYKIRQRLSVNMWRKRAVFALDQPNSSIILLNVSMHSLSIFYGLKLCFLYHTFGRKMYREMVCKKLYTLKLAVKKTRKLVSSAEPTAHIYYNLAYLIFIWIFCCSFFSYEKYFYIQSNDPIRAKNARDSLVCTYWWYVV